MPGPIFVTVLSGQTVSSACTLPRADRPLALFCASHGAASSVALQFAASSGTPPFVTPSGSSWTVFSGNGDGLGTTPAPASRVGSRRRTSLPYTVLEKLGV